MDILQPKLPVYTDERGTIEMIVEDADIKSISRITSVAGSLRANHLHFSDWHICLMLTGTMKYYQRLAYSLGCPTMLTLNAGDIFYTAPHEEHLMEAITDLSFMCFSKNSRKQADYESDTVRLPFNLKEIYEQYNVHTNKGAKE